MALLCNKLLLTLEDNLIAYFLPNVYRTVLSFLATQLGYMAQLSLQLG